MTPGNAKYALCFRVIKLIREKDHRAHPVGVMQVKIDSSNKNYTHSSFNSWGQKKKLVMRWECTWKMVEKFISGCHILCLGSIYIFFWGGPGGGGVGGGGGGGG